MRRGFPFLVIAFLLIGCGGSSEEASAPEPVSVPKPAEPTPGRAPADETGMVVRVSANTFDDTVSLLGSAINERGLSLMARVDHSDNAKRAGLELAPTTLFIFGNPSVGTPLMTADPTIAIDLPQKMLVWIDDKDIVRVAYNDPWFVARRHGIEDETALQNISQLLIDLGEAAASPTGGTR